MDDASHIGVQAPAPGLMVRVIGPHNFDKPAMVTHVHTNVFFGQLAIDVVVFQGDGHATLGYLDSSDLANVIASATLPHKTTYNEIAAKRGGRVGPFYWIWPTETP